MVVVLQELLAKSQRLAHEARQLTSESNIEIYFGGY